MMEFLFAPQTFPFLVALFLMVAIAIIEGGLGLGDFEIPGPLGEFCSWMRVGQVPVLVMLVTFLFFFGVGGLLIQKGAQGLIGLLPMSVAMVASAGVAIPLTRGGSKLIAKVMPKDESSAINRQILIGKCATITTGKAKKGYPAQGKTKDHFGKTHYFLIEPDEDATFEEGESVLLVKYDGTRFYAIKANETLIN